MKQQAKKKSTWKKVLDWVVTVLFGGLIVFVGGIKIYQMVAKDPYIFGYQFPVVLTDSMEDKYMVNDMIVIKKVNPNQIKVGDDISFYWNINGVEMSMTHRVKELTFYEDASLNEGYHYTFVTSGINKASTQCPDAYGNPGDCTYQTQTFHEDRLIGKVVSNSKFLTFLYKGISSVWGLIIVILIPSFYLVITSVIDIFKNLDEKEEALENAPNKTSNTALKDLDQKEIERLKKQLLEEMLKEKQNKGGNKDVE